MSEYSDNQNRIGNDEVDIGHVVTAEELTIDEGAIIRERERLEQEKKRFRKKRITVVLMILGILLLAALIWFLVWGRKQLTNDEQTTVKIETATDQSVLFVKVNSINGNEINYTVLKARSESSAEGNEQSNSQKQDQPAGDSQGIRPDFSEGRQDGADVSKDFGSRSMPEGFDPGSRGGNFRGESGDSVGENGENQRTRPDFSGSRFEGAGNFGNGRNNGGQRASSLTVLSYDGVNYSLTEETAITLIPVGTEVTTKLGTKTTFSRISAGDCLALVIEMVNGEETVMAVYIVG